MNKDIKNNFDILYEKWYDLIHNTDLTESSNTYDYINTEFYQQIIQLGTPALPLIIEKIMDGEFLLNHAFFKIARLDKKHITNGKKFMSEQEISKLLIQWWNKNNDANNFTNTY